MRPDVFAPRRQVAADRCEHCDRDVDRVWLVPGDVLNSCRSCFERVTGSPPRHDHGHSSPPPAALTGARASSTCAWTGVVPPEGEPGPRLPPARP